MDLLNEEKRLDRLYGNNLDDKYRTNTRYNYDPCRTIKRLEESTGPGRYILNVPGPGSNPSVIVDPMIIGQKWNGNLMTNPIQVEEFLLGLNRPINHRDLVSKDNYEKYLPQTSIVNYPKNNVNWTEQSRATNPAWEIKDKEQCLWGFPLYDPQENVIMSFQNNVNSRIVAKDNYKYGRC